MLLRASSRETAEVPENLPSLQVRAFFSLLLFTVKKDFSLQG